MNQKLSDAKIKPNELYNKYRGFYDCKAEANRWLFFHTAF